MQTYNRDDCRSTAALRDWLERLRADAIAGGTPIARPLPKEGDASEDVGELESRQQAAREQLAARSAVEASSPDHAQHPLWLLAYLIDWHRRESKARVVGVLPAQGFAGR